MRAASALVSTAEAVEADYGVPITNKRICVTPMALVDRAVARHARTSRRP